jgi:hypothetical protein
VTPAGRLIVAIGEASLLVGEREVVANSLAGSRFL